MLFGLDSSHEIPFRPPVAFRDEDEECTDTKSSFSDVEIGDKGVVSVDDKFLAELCT